MRRFPGLILILLLAACAKQAPSPAAKTARNLPPDKIAASAHQAPLPPATQAPASAGPVPAADGEALFSQNCATCHMADGNGVPYLQPGIRGSAWLSNPDPQLLLTLILRGSAVLGAAAQAYENDMAPHTHLSDAEIAALATYARQRFGIPPLAKPVTPAQVAIARNRPGLPE